MAGETGSAREEAERLVAAVLAMAGGNQDENPGGTGAKLRDGLGNLGDTLTGLVNQITGAPAQDSPSSPAGRHTTYGWSTGSLECCVCPVCRLIAGMRDPSPKASERLATGAGDVAMGVASLMRGLSAVTSVVKPAPKPARPRRPAPPPPDPDAAWSAATRTARGPDIEPAPDQDESPWAAATRAEARQAEETREAARRADVAVKAAEAREAAEAAETARQADKAHVPPEAGEAAGQPARANEPKVASPAAPQPRPMRTAPRAGQDVWAAATSADPGGVAAADDVAHDEAGDVPDAGGSGREAETP